MSLFVPHAQIICDRFTPDVIEKMSQCRWWEWPDAEIRKIVPLLSSSDISAFFDYCAKRLVQISDKEKK